MKKLIAFAAAAIALASCQTQPKEDYSWIKNGLDVAQQQLMLAAHEAEGTGKLPRTTYQSYDMNFLCEQLKEILQHLKTHCVSLLLPKK